MPCWHNGARRASRYIFEAKRVIHRLLTRALQVLEGGQVVNRTGAVGKLRSVYCRDPDGNLVEYASGHRAGFPASEAHIQKQGIQLYVARSSVPHKPHNLEYMLQWQHVAAIPCYVTERGRCLV